MLSLNFIIATFVHVNINQQHTEHNTTYSIKQKIAFTLRVIMIVLIQLSLFLHLDFYNQYKFLFQVINGLNTILTVSVIISILSFLILTWYNRRIRKSDEVRGSFALGINRIATILNVVFIVIGLMQALGIDPAKFITSITIVAMAIALIFRDYITNMISGLIIMFSDQYTIGDRIKVGEYEGKILDITLTNIVVINESEDVIMIPNNLVFTVITINQSLENKHNLVITFELPVLHPEKKSQLKNRIDQCLSKHEYKNLIEKTILNITNISRKTIQFKLTIFIEPTNQSIRSELKNDILTEILEGANG